MSDLGLTLGGAAGAGGVAGDAYLPGALQSLALEGGPGAAAGGIAGADEIGAGAGGRSLLGQFGDIAGQYGPKLGKGLQAAQQSGLLSQQTPQATPAPQPPGAGPQQAGMPNSAQILYPETFQPDDPQKAALQELLRRRMQQYGLG